MQAARPIQLPERLRVVVTLAQLLEQFDNASRVPSADQYRSIVTHLKDELARLDADTALDFVLSHFPATAALYENLHYEHAGLCRSPLEVSLTSELQARDVIRRLSAQRPPEPPDEGDQAHLPVEPDRGPAPPLPPDGGEPDGEPPAPI